MQVQKALEASGVTVDSAEISLVPKTTILLEPRAAEQTLKLLDHLEELDDVQKAYTNADFPPEVLEQYQAAA
jgi:transcriptional/translational regulatory protein YebC/TACO1